MLDSPSILLPMNDIIRDRRVNFRSTTLTHLRPTNPHLPFCPDRVYSTRVSKRSSAASTSTTSTLTRLSASSQSAKLARTHPPSSLLREQTTQQQQQQQQQEQVIMSESIPSSPIRITSQTYAEAPRPPASPPLTAVSSISSTDSDKTTSTATAEPASSRGRVISRRSSGTNIVARDDPKIELQEGDETFEPDDARAMSPRRTSEDLEKMGQDVRSQLSKQAKILHESLLEIFNRIDAVKQEHDKLDSNNKFLQKYIGDLMSTSKITSTGASGRKK